MSTIDWGRRLATVLMPPVCCLCGAHGQTPDLDLCEVCGTLLPLFGPESPPGSKAALPDGTLLRTLSFFKYEYPVDHFIRALKFRGERGFARILGTLMGMRMAAAERKLGWERPVCIVPMPLHPSRYTERGFNQATEIARYAARVLRIDVEEGVLVRTLNTREQSGLSLAERRRNVLGAFRVARPVPRGRIALLDDVVTSGSTALAASRALLDAGAEELELWAAARVNHAQTGDHSEA